MAYDDPRAEVLAEFAAYLNEKADNADWDGNELFAEGMRNAATDAELFLSFREVWLQGRDEERTDG